MLLIGLITTQNAGAVTPPGTVISNTANASFTFDGASLDSASNAEDVTVSIGSTPSAVQFFQYAPSAEDAALITAQAVSNEESTAFVRAGPTGCSAGSASSPFTPLPNPTYPGGATLNVRSSLSLIATSQFHQGEPVFIELTDLDQNLNAAKRDTVQVTVSDAKTRDREFLRLSETAADAGVFVGFIQSVPPASKTFDCELAISSGTGVRVDYTDPFDETDTSVTQALVDPAGTVFDSATGAPVSGATLTIIDALTGQPATVFGDDGISRFPSSITSGERITDSGGTVYRFAAGGYRFPFLVPGTYSIEVTPPDVFVAPSGVPIPELQELPGAPFALNADASFGDEFTINAGPPLNVDIPVDPLIGALALTKTATREQVAIGDFVQYRLELSNTSATVPAADVILSDDLPSGFRYQEGSASVEGAAIAEPTVSTSGDRLSFAVGDLDPAATVVLTYVLNVSAGARMGDATNTAVARDARGTPSNVARATVRVEDDLLRSRSFIAGRIMLGNCEVEHAPTVGTDLPGVGGIRLVLEDGRYVITDDGGMYHFEGVAPGTHRVQVDLASLPDDLAIHDCERNTRFAGTPYAQFVDVQAGVLWRADFYVREKTPRATTSQTPRENQPAEPEIRPLPALPEPPLQATPELDDAWFARATKDLEWLAPSNGFRPAIPALKIAVKHDASYTLRLALNGEPVSPLNYDGQTTSKDGGIAVSQWRGVDLIEGPNELKASTVDASGNVIQTIETSAHFSGLPVTVELASDYSRAVADGKTAPVIAVRFRDQWGEPVREGVVGDYSVDPPYFPRQRALAQRRALLDLEGGATTYQVGPGGIARLYLEPTTETGRAKLRFGLDKSRTRLGATGDPLVTQSTLGLAIDTEEDVIDAWISGAERDWILVGFGETAVGYNTLSGNAEALDAAGEDDKLYEDGRVAFYAKGQVRGKWLLTVAYDTDGEESEQDERLEQVIDPEEFYTLYGDVTEQRFDAASTEKLYVKLEREQFYALFGDYETGLTVTELSRYSRSLTGLKTEFLNKRYVLNAFAAQTDFAFVRDEILGNGTSGLYRLSRNDLVINSEKVTIETRDRFRSELVLEARQLTRFIDYNIDYFDGTLFFKQPIFSRDENLNPIYIVAEYEVEGGAGEDLTAGGRGAIKFLNQRLEIGLSAIHEGNSSASNGDLQGADLTYRLTEATQMRAEFATSQTDDDALASSGEAYLAEVIHLGEKFDTRAYVREQDNGFGLGQQPGTEAGTAKFGVDGRYRFTEHLFADGQLYREEVSFLDARRDVAFGQFTYQQDLYSLSAGLRHAEDRLTDGQEFTSDLVTVGASRALFDKRWNLRGLGEFAVGNNANPDFPTRVILGTDYLITPSTLAFVEQEFTDGDAIDTQSTRVGVRTSPWARATVSTSVEDQTSEDGQRLFGNLGLTQGVQVTEYLDLDFGVDRSQTIREEGAPVFNPNVPPASGTIQSDDFTAISAGATYTQDLWSAAARIENRFADQDDQFGAIFGFYRQQTPGLGFSLGGQYLSSESLGGTSNTLGDLRFSVAYRPVESHWIALNRLDFNYEEIDTSLERVRARKSVNNLNLNWLPNRTNQFALHHGVKYVLDSFDSEDYEGWIQAFDGEYRHDINERFDVGVQAGVLHSFTADNYQYSIGPTFGMSLVKNLWVSLGYNFRGFEDDDFSTAGYTSQGPYIKLRFAFDQNSVRDALNWFKGKRGVTGESGSAAPSLVSQPGQP